MIPAHWELPSSLQYNLRPWRAMHGPIYGLKVDSDGVPYWAIFRPITKREADLLDLIEDELERDESLLQLALLHPEPTSFGINHWSAGAVDAVLKAIVSVSGWTTEGFVQSLEEGAIYASSMHGAMVSFICAAFHAYKLEEIDNMTSRELARHLRMAELMHGQPFDFQRWMDPEGWAKKNNRGRRMPGGKRLAHEQLMNTGRIDPKEAAMAEAAGHDPFDGTAVKLNKNDPDMIRKLIDEQRRGMMA